MSHFRHTSLTRSDEWFFGVAGAGGERLSGGRSGKAVSGAERRHPMFREACLPEHWVNKFFWAYMLNCTTNMKISFRFRKLFRIKAKRNS